MKDFIYCPFCKAQMAHVFIEHEGRERNVCPVCGYIQYHNPLPSVGMLVVKDGKCLLIKRGKAPGKGAWAPPSGFVEVGETLEEAAARELKEETGIIAHATELIGAYCEPNDVYGYVITIVYLCEIDGGELIAGDDAEDAGFFDLNEIPKMFFPCFEKAIKRYRETH